jgi:A/G-specific adenine glycosylase
MFTQQGMEPKLSVSRNPITSRLLRWYASHARDLPWRHTQDPYGIWVSEIMLQQTQVETVIPYYYRFLTRFPSVKTLAKARTDQVLKSWENLGYYSRARHLHAAAKEIVARWGGRLPQNRKDLLGLPGIGEYTAAAILSIAFE